MYTKLLVMVFMSIPAGLMAFQNAPEKAATVEGVTEYRFSNGARLLLVPDASTRTITVNMTVLVGSRHEGYGEAGMAHLLEHMVFKGTPTFADVPKALRDHGANFNGTTNSDRTNYFETLPASDENLEFAIHLECDRLINSFVRHEDLISEFTVVRNEFERGENSPQGVLFDRVASAAYEWHNYGKSTIGNRSDIERVPIDNLQAFYKKFYQPDNVVLIVAGRFEEAKAVELAQKYLGSIPRPERQLSRTYTEEPAQDGERIVELRRVGAIGSIAAAWHVPAASHEDWAPLSVLASVLNEDKVGLLEKNLVEAKLASSASAQSGNSHDPDLFFLTVQPTEGNLEKARAEAIATMDSLATFTADAEAVDRAKLRAKRQAQRTLSDANSMAYALSSASSHGDWRLFFLQRDRIQAVTADDVTRVARTYFPAINRTLGTFIPVEQSQRLRVPTVPSIMDIVKDYKGGAATALGEEFDPTPANIDARTVQRQLGKIQLALLPKTTRGNTVDMIVTLNFGNEKTLNGKSMAAAMIGPMLMAGTAELNRQALQQRMNELDVRISSGGGGRGRGGRGGMGGPAGAVSFSIEAKRDSLTNAIDLLGQILRQPAFPQDDFDQFRSQSTSMLKQFMTEPQSLAPSALSRALSQYGPEDVRYVRSPEETLAEIEKMNREDIVNVYNEQLKATTGQISIVGDFDPEVAVAAIEKAIGDWTGEDVFAPILTESPVSYDISKKTIETPDKANAVFLAGTAFPMYDDHPDTEALTIANFIFGGGTLSSRLGDRIRQKEGLSYGVSSSVSVPTQGNDARFTINAITNPQNIDAVEAAVMEELKRFIEAGPTQDEVDTAKKAYLELRKVGRANEGAIAGQWNANLYLGRTFKHAEEREARIAALTVEDVKNAFAHHINVEKLKVVRAGDFAKEKE